MIVAAFCGCGKSTFAKKHSNEALDLMSMPYSWLLPEKDEKETESIKGAEWLLHNPLFPKNYIFDLLEANKKYKYVLIPPIYSVLSYLRKYNVPYILVYPNINLKNEYRQLFIERGNSQSFLDVFVENEQFEERIHGLMEDESATMHIILQKGQFLEDVLEKEISTLHIEDKDYSVKLQDDLNQMYYDIQHIKKYDACLWINDLYDSNSSYVYRFDMNDIEEIQCIVDIGKRCYENDIRVNSQFDIDFIKIYYEHFTGNSKIKEEHELIELKTREELLSYIDWRIHERKKKYGK